ncbi:MAG: amidase, hydantoinase/carbamoylase family [Candidatus Solibacter sp.]|jgi:allantoate deiminase|nr:amidase, hydantoinase/carbamoylase family [Candidatus Solibacter sp.]
MSVIERCRELAQFTEEPGHITRTYLSPPMHAVHERVSQWLVKAGCAVTIDAVGNLRGLYPAAKPGAPRLVIGSHLDTVPHGGAYDGPLGVLIGVALVESLRGSRLSVEIEVIGFSEEEGVRFGVPFIGSRGVVGTIDDVLRERIEPAIREFGLKPEEIPEAAWQQKIAGFLEFHIEQGPVLDSLDYPLGVVSAIAGQTRGVVEFYGKANHAGTTPMELRRDALATAAEWIGAVEKLAARTPELLATVGSLTVEPGASNVIAGRATASLDIRHAVDGIRRAAVDRAFTAAFDIAAGRGVQCATRVLLDQASVPMDPALTGIVERAVRDAGCPVHRMISGAGHDAMIVAQRFPTAMLFVRSPGGISHHPDEIVRAADVASALSVGRRILECWR